MRLTTAPQGLISPTRWTPLGSSALVVGGLLITYGLDRATGSAPVQHLYYAPIVLAGVRFQMRGGMLAALAAIVLYHAANLHLLAFTYRESDLVQMALFLAVGWTTAKLTLDANRLRELAMTDDLTGLHNLRSFETRLLTMVRASRETRVPMALLVLDVDRLKSMNDQYGHLAGAEAVRTVGQVIGRHIPPEAVACRYGGDEFAVAIPYCTPFMAQRVAADLCHAVQAVAPTLAGRAFQTGTLSISVGACSGPFEKDATARAGSPHDAATGEAMFRKADAALYKAKAGGRNRACV